MASVFKEGKRPNVTHGVSFHDLKRQKRFWHRVGPDRATAKALAERIERLERLRTSGDPLDTSLTQWLERLPTALRDKLVQADLVDGHRAAAGLSVEQHLKDFAKSLRVKGDTEKHVEQTKRRVLKVLTVGQVKTLSDISPARIEQALSIIASQGRRKLTSKTKKYYLACVDSFCKWAVQNGRMSSNPLKHLTVKLTGDSTKRRRPLTVDEVRRLVSTTAIEPDRFGIPGHERALIYVFTAETGCRAGEVRALVVGDFDLSQDLVNVTIRSGTTKNRKERSLLLSTGLSSLIRHHVGGKLPTVSAFRLPSKYNMADMVRQDCQAASIPVVDDAGREVDFHALRVTAASLLVAEGFDVKLAQQRLGHHDPSLTLKVYAKTYREGEVAAMRRMPDLTAAPDKLTVIATGTDDKMIRVDENDPNSAQHSAQQARIISVHEVSSSFAGHEDGSTDRAERKPLSTKGDSVMVHDDSSSFAKGRGGIRTHDGLRQRICNPLPWSARARGRYQPVIVATPCLCVKYVSGN